MPCYTTGEPIYALATPFSPSAIAVIRASGDNVLSMIAPYFTGKIASYPSSHAIHGFIHDGNGRNIDEVMLIKYEKGHGYTSEEAFEIMSHGSLPVIRAIENFLESIGIRRAERGEFTYRAFMHGRMDLTEAEAYFLQTAYSTSKHGEKNVVAGANLLTPYQALAYCRIRQDVSGEFGRTDRQRKVLMAIFNQLKSEDIMTITNICMKALKYVKTDLTEQQIRSLMTSVITMGTTEIEQLRIPYEGSYTEGRLGGNGAWVMQVDYEANSQALQYFIFGTGEDPGVNDEYGVGNDNFIEGYYPEKTEGISTY